MNLTCMVKDETLRWNVTSPLNPYITETRSVTIFDSFSQSRKIVIGSTTLIISRLLLPSNHSSQVASALISENVTVDLNQTTIKCEQNITTIHVIGVNSKSMVHLYRYIIIKYCLDCLDNI